MRKVIINLNNFIHTLLRTKAKSNEIIMLGPHCLKSSKCKQNIIDDINNCLLCGKCQTKSLVELSRKTGIRLNFASGGLMALGLVKDKRLSTIVAIACEKELVAGIFSLFSKKRILGITLNLPNGPCKDTNFDFDRLTKYINILLEI